ncbi:MAG TPA: exopolysaccharide biosynthesis protein [Methylotenera sp.]|nr:exopolysaccharide biosynthesis protein [Methylotenera sp.]
MCDYATLVNTLNQFAEQSKHKPLKIGEALDSLDEAGYAFIAIILVLPFLQPLPLGPITVIGGVAFATLGWQLFHGHGSPVLPQKLNNIEFSENTWRILVNVCLKILGFCRKFTKPRYQTLVNGKKGQKIGGFILLAAGGLMAIPFGVLPLNNLLPGLAILFYCIGELESDGLMYFIAFFWLIVTVIYFIAFFLALWFFGQETLAFFNS